MTARPQESSAGAVTLLPLPESIIIVYGYGDLYTDTEAEAYARANVGSAVIHLRAELCSEMAITKQLRRELDEAEAALASAQALEDELRAANIAYAEQVAKLIGRAGNADLRNERLAEALRKAQEIFEWNAIGGPTRNLIDNALREVEL